MGTTKNEEQCPRVDYKARTRAMLEHYYTIAEEMTLRIHQIVKSGEDIRSTEARPGVATLQHSATKAIDEIVRLTPLAGVDQMDVSRETKSVGWEYDKEKEAELLALVPDA
jgi:hypothetical protein